jgi:hypothetical protein
MKRSAQTFSIYGIFILYLIFLAACRGDSDINYEDTVGGFKEISTDPVAGSVTITVLCVMANSCGNFDRFEYSVDGSIIIVHFYSFYDGDVCAEALKEEEHTITIADLLHGTYSIEPAPGYYYDFYTYLGWSKTLTVNI